MTDESNSGSFRDEKRVQFSFPGKTFLVGEYLALKGGPSLVLATGPRFVWTGSFQSGGSESASSAATSAGPLKSPFAAQSPAGLFLASHAAKLSPLTVEFFDPHHGKGGLGASTAQFAGAWALVKGLRHVDPERFDWKALLQDYRAVAWNGEGLPPSGADLVAQLTGQVTWFDGVGNRARRLGWAFQDLSFTLIRTGKKLATHEHLRGMGQKAALHDELRSAVIEATKAFESVDAKGLIDAVACAGRALKASGLQAQATLDLLAGLSEVNGVLATKGCGAMGADVILCLHEPASFAAIEAWAEANGLSLCGTEADLAPGFLYTTDAPAK